MLNENDVVAAVCAHLENSGYEIKQRCTTIEHGDDIIAVSLREGETLWVEAKGGTSSREGSARYNKPYTASQVFDRVAKGLYTAIKLREEHAKDSDSVGLAFPDTKRFMDLLIPISDTLNKLKIRVYLVSEKRNVRPL